MKPIICVNGKNGKPLIREVVNEKGLSVGEYVDDGKEKKPAYYVLRERVQL